MLWDLGNKHTHPAATFLSCVSLPMNPKFGNIKSEVVTQSRESKSILPKLLQPWLGKVHRSAPTNKADTGHNPTQTE